MCVAIERFSLGFALILALLAVAITSGPAARRSTSNYIAALFVPSPADTGSFPAVSR